ncbi:MAG: 4-hydroxythreonine-4-phosphate dehydrogenase PdxA, partial [Deltaproteobacteria bacterium]|nr:4-hydroxythreonine-4-phosphate dehydrogenase PdxA [Deltaproteobacteria bacterium]
MKHLPLIGITMGDPAGIGPEIIATALADSALYECCRPVVLGDPGVLSSTISSFLPKIPQKLSINIISNPAQAKAMPGVIDLIAISELKPGIIQPGRPVVEGGRAMVEYILRAVEMTMQGEFGAMVTSPIS